MIDRITVMRNRKIAKLTDTFFKGRFRILLQAAGQFPNTVSLPVRTTRALAVPLMTWVPFHRLLFLAFMGTLAGNTAAIFSAGNDSPVMALSLTCNSTLSSILQSAGMISPHSG